MLNRIFSREAIFIVAVMWGVFLIDLVLPGISFNHLGIKPRNFQGLIGILFSPFLHGGFSHIIANTIPLLLLSGFVRLSIGPQKMLYVMSIGVLGSGLGTWLFSSGDLVIGASGLVFSLIGFLLADAWFSPTLRSWTVAILSFFLYGGALLSFFVYVPFISWAAHFWGFCSGLAIALSMRRSR
ncbi:MAG: membrane associated rhomboid family serine protease [Desulforhopalus sp.]|jgi:membrane associated rhomboid family serine protease